MNIYEISKNNSVSAKQSNNYENICYAVNCDNVATSILILTAGRKEIQIKVCESCKPRFVDNDRGELTPPIRISRNKVGLSEQVPMVNIEKYGNEDKNFDVGVNTHNEETTFTRTALIETLKQELASVDLKTFDYLNEIKKHKQIRPSNQCYYDYDLGLDFSIDTENSESIKTKIYDNRKYYYHAHHYLKLGLFQGKDIPSFWIHLRDLSDKLILELYKLDRDDMNFILKQAVGRIIEDISSDIYHNSISCRLKVELRY